MIRKVKKTKEEKCSQVNMYYIKYMQQQSNRFRFDGKFKINKPCCLDQVLHITLYYIVLSGNFSVYQHR